MLILGEARARARLKSKICCAPIDGESQAIVGGERKLRYARRLLSGIEKISVDASAANKRRARNISIKTPGTDNA